MGFQLMKFFFWGNYIQVYERAPKNAENRQIMERLRDQS